MASGVSVLEDESSGRTCTDIYAVVREEFEGGVVPSGTGVLVWKTGFLPVFLDFGASQRQHKYSVFSHK
jgi:hypothetical protein